MKNQLHEQTVKLSKETPGLFSTAVVESMHENDDGNIVASYAKIAESLAAAGLVTEYTDGKTGAWCKVYKPYTPEERAAASKDATDEDCRYLVAQGFAPNRKLAFSHAVFGAVREENANHAVKTTLAAAEVKVDEKLHAELERRFILEGGQKRLDVDVAGMVAQQKAKANA